MNDDEIIKKAQTILRRRVRRNTIVNSPTQVRDYCQVKLAGLSYEVFCVLYLNAQNRALHFAELFQGTIDGAAVYPRRVVEESIIHQAAAVVLVHNHPSGVAEPSQADVRITERIKIALGMIDVRVLDHFIVTGDEMYSFAENSLI